MSTSKTLAEKLASHPELEKRVSESINLVEAESGHLDRADEAEEAVIENLKEQGNELLTPKQMHHQIRNCCPEKTLRKYS